MILNANNSFTASCANPTSWLHADPVITNRVAWNKGACNAPLRLALFGLISDGQMILNDAGQLAEKEWQKNLKIHVNSVMHEFVIIPNDFHVIVGS